MYFNVPKLKYISGIENNVLFLAKAPRVKKLPGIRNGKIEFIL
jgi:hypothetical protein